MDLKEELVDNHSLTDDYTCEFGYPDESCYECDVDGCELTCSNYESDTTEQVYTKTNCVSCGKELQLLSDSEDADVYCVACFLNK
jgi:hypothetical protein